MPTIPVMTPAAFAGRRQAGTPAHSPSDVDAAEVAVVRLPIADARGSVVGFELVFAHASNGATPEVNARSTAAMLDGAFADIGLDRLTGSHPAWLSIAPEFLVAVGMPPVRPDRAVIQLDTRSWASTSARSGAAASSRSEPAAVDLLPILQRLSMAGYTLALSDYDGRRELGEVLDLCSVVKVPVDRVGPEELTGLAGRLAAGGIQVVATGVDDADTLALCRRIGVPLVQGTVLAQPHTVLGRNVAGTSGGSLRALADLAGGDLTFEEVERIIASDIGLSLKLLRYVNSAFFALPRTISTVREALGLLGSRTVQRWAMVVVLADAPNTPDELVALALQRGRMCETLAAAIAPEDRATLFTIGMFSVADALLGMSMADVLDELPFAPDVQAALLRHEGVKGRLLAAVLAYERGEFPELPGIAASGASVAGAYRDAVEWADDATRSVRALGA